MTDYRLVARDLVTGQPRLVDPVTGGSGYQRTFTAADLSVAGLLPVSHNLGVYPSSVSAWDNAGEQIEFFDSVSATDLNTVVIDFSSFLPIVGVWRIAVGA